MNGFLSYGCEAEHSLIQVIFELPCRHNGSVKRIKEILLLRKENFDWIYSYAD